MYDDSDPFTRDPYEDGEDGAYNHGYKTGMSGGAKHVPHEFLNFKQEWINGWNDADELCIKKLEIEKQKNAPSGETIKILKKLINKSKR